MKIVRGRHPEILSSTSGSAVARLLRDALSTSRRIVTFLQPVLHLNFLAIG